MSEIICIETPWGDDVAIRLDRTEAMLAAGRALGDHIKGLPLTAEDNDRLVALMVAQVQEAERSAFVQGFKMGRDYERAPIPD